MNARFRRDEGAALALVLVMLAIMSTFAVVVVEAARFSLKRAANQSGIEQARWYLVGAEGLAQRQIARLKDASAAIDQSEWQGRPVGFPLDDGNLTITVTDGSNCFNLNSVVERNEDGSYVARPAGQVQFARLLDLAGVNSGANSSALLTDWIDSDEVALPGGGEDSAYAQSGRSYRPGNTLLGDLAELRRVEGFDAETAIELSRFACVRPDAAPTTVNVNTILPAQAEVLATIFGGELNPAAAREIIRSRPRGGWADIDAFLAHPRISGMETPETLRQQLSVSSRYFIMHGRVINRRVSENVVSLIDTTGGVRVLRRVYGVGARGNVL